ncbi:MAG TPA: RDD family protein [Solirubrobacteraceae bacterium]|jgi:uncharacterized RDD family membrane protein YckC|nr:RDD family protein [Solirubrobacteraceae bacterium]
MSDLGSTSSTPAPGWEQPSSPPAYAGKGSGPRAGWWRRFAAAFLDGILISIVNVIVSQVTDATVGYLASIVVGVAYFTYFEGGPTGQTLGKKALGIRVIDANAGGPIGYGRAVIRYFGRWISSIPLLLGYFWMLWDKERQCWHDKFATDYVVPEDAYPVR